MDLPSLPLLRGFATSYEVLIGQSGGGEVWAVGGERLVKVGEEVRDLCPTGATAFSSGLERGDYLGNVV